MTAGFYLYSPALGLLRGCLHYISVMPSACQSPESGIILSVIKWPGITAFWSSVLRIDAVAAMSNVGNTEKPNICEPLLVSKNMSTHSVSPFSLLFLARTLWGPPNQSCFLYCWSSPIYSLEQRLAEFLCRGPNGKYLRLRRPQVCFNGWILLLEHRNGLRGYINECGRLCLNKTLFVAAEM